MIYDLTLTELISYFDDINEKKFRAIQVFEWLYKKRVKSFQEMTNIKKDLLLKLASDFTFPTLKLVDKQVSKDGTTKYLFELEDKNTIEVVLMKYQWGNSLCITTQVGCNIGCAFCASGLLGKFRDLSAGEIVLQVMKVEEIEDLRISNIVIMGIGEPFDNYNNTMKAIKILNHPKGFEIGARHITVSTSGIVPRIYDFALEPFQVNLAISLHAPNDSLRNELMKINKVYNLDELIKACKDYINKTNRRITFEYILLDGVNDSSMHANQLSDLIRGMNAYVNLIPYNEVSEFKYKRTEKENALKFYDILKKRGINVTLRQEKGIDIFAACGQLRSKNM
ncbi:23S rRNA (adenine(2503)-C(2))-methyltransferase RlmN [Mycoplasmatota bacterium]|nr:23S rRNA (adenine(2503)-C(2))-methyltransferase RlmN [Mycoplasmatota bacterium]